MTGTTGFSRRFGIAIAVLLALAANVQSHAAERSARPARSAPPATLLSPDQLEELDEIWIRGKRIFDQIIDAEDDFFPLYNKLNRNNDYDIKCDYAYLNPGSMIMSRACVPGFAGRYIEPPPYAWSSCYGCSDGGYEPPPYSHIIMAKEHELRRQLQKVIHSDPQLLAMADHLGGLYMELQSANRRYRKVLGLDDGRSTARTRPVKPYTGPRAL